MGLWNLFSPNISPPLPSPPPSSCTSSAVAITLHSVQYLPCLSFFLSSDWLHSICMAASEYVTHLTSDYSTLLSLSSASLFVIHWLCTLFLRGGVGRFDMLKGDHATMSHMSHNVWQFLKNCVQLAVIRCYYNYYYYYFFINHSLFGKREEKELKIVPDRR